MIDGWILEVKMNHRLPPVGQPRPVERVLAQLQQHGRKVEPHCGYWMAQCPAHDDPRPSLSIRPPSS